MSRSGVWRRCDAPSTPWPPWDRRHKLALTLRASGPSACTCRPSRPACSPARRARAGRRPLCRGLRGWKGFLCVSRRWRRRDRSDSLARPRRPRPRGCVSDAAGRTERLDVLLLGLALPRRHGRARVVLDHGAKVTCGRFRRDAACVSWVGVPAAVLQRTLGFESCVYGGAVVRAFFCKRIGSWVVHFETCASVRVRSDSFACGRFSCTKLCSNFLRDGGERCRA